MELNAFPLTWLTEKLGDFTIDETIDFERNRNRIFHVISGEEQFYLKMHQEYKYWNAEVYAYLNWCTCFREYFPECAAVFHEQDQFGILTRSLGGIPLDKLTFNNQITGPVWFKAGLIARKMIDSFENQWFGVPDCAGNPFDGFNSDPVAYYQAGLEKLQDKAARNKLLDKKQTDLVNWAAANSHCFINEKPCAINRDFTPGNWIVSRDGHFLGIVDLEDICWGLKAELFQHLWTRYGIENPDGMDAFFRGFGDHFMKNNPVQAGLVCIKSGLSTLIYGIEKKSAIHYLRGKRILDHLVESDSRLNI